MRKTTIWVPTRLDTNKPVQSQIQAKKLEISDLKRKKNCSIRVAKTKVLISCAVCAVTAQLICGFVFAYGNRWFCHAAAYMYLNKMFGWTDG